MKYIKTYEENINENVFENNKFLVIKPKSYDSLLELSKDTEWRIEDINAKYLPGLFRPEKYRYSNDLFVVIDKLNDNKYLFDFKQDNFWDKDENDIYLKDFFDNKPELVTLFGDIIYCDKVVEENGEYWIVVDDYIDFEDYFKLDRNTRNDYIKIVLGGDAAVEIYDYNPSDFDIDVSVKLDEDNLILMRSILYWLKVNDSDYEYDIFDVETYYDVVEIVNDYDIVDLRDFLKRCVSEGEGNADADAAYDKVTDEIYKFFDLELGSAKWQKHKGKEKLWIKFKNKLAACNAKFIITNIDSSFDDDVIEFDPPENAGTKKDFIEYFNECMRERYTEYFGDNLVDEIYDALENNKKATIEDLEHLIAIKKYNV